jgi:RND family efflux transporter MFP subunit
VIRCPTAAACLLAAVVVAACRQAQTAPLYEKVRVQRRDIIVTATSVGMIRPILTFSVKSKAWGEILEMPVQTGEAVKAGQLLARIDPRVQRDNLAIAEANLSRAQAQLGNADAQFQRAEALYRAQAIAETDYEAAKLADVTAKAAVVTTTAYLQIAKDAMEDTQVRAPIAGTILELDAGRGTVISSPTLGGGTVILKMANLDTVQDSSLIIETDIGRVQPGMPVTTLVDAYPDHPFQGTVLKIVPQAQVVQNATKFPVLTNLPNDGGLLKPGMNTRVQVHTGQRQNVLAIPNGALRTSRDVAAAAALLGLDPTEVQKEVAAGTARPQPTAGGDTAGGTRAGADVHDPERADDHTPCRCHARSDGSAVRQDGERRGADARRERDAGHAPRRYQSARRQRRRRGSTRARRRRAQRRERRRFRRDELRRVHAAGR